MIYLDTSALGALYWPDIRTRQVQQVLRTEKPAVSHLTRIEFVSTLDRFVRIGELGKRDAKTIADRFAGQVRSGALRVLPIDAAVIDLAIGLHDDFDCSLATLDSLHVAVAIAHRLPLVTLDKLMAKSAKKLGVKVVDLGTSR